mmetsp:Transcript_167/g.214  ORF Transcript_167/g.214 Transcript_167/m.214 type:complete len:110 (-) Transcript_167:824-1153(-)
MDTTSLFSEYTTQIMDSGLQILENYPFLSENQYFLSLIFLYLIVKLGCRVIWPAKVCWDPVCLVHNVVSVLSGLYLIYTWEEKNGNGELLWIVESRCNHAGVAIRSLCI